MLDRSRDGKSQNNLTTNKEKTKMQIGFWQIQFSVCVSVFNSDNEVFVSKNNMEEWSTNSKEMVAQKQR